MMSGIEELLNDNTNEVEDEDQDEEDLGNILLLPEGLEVYESLEDAMNTDCITLITP